MHSGRDGQRDRAATVGRRGLLRAVVGGAALGTVAGSGSGAEVAEGPTLYVGGPERGLRAVDAATGEKRWTSGPERGPAEQPGVSAPIAVDGVVYFCTERETGAGTDPVVYAVRAATGEVVWERSVPWRASPTVVDGRVHVMTETGLTALDAATGRRLWRRSLGSRQFSMNPPTVVDGRVHAAVDGTVYALDAESGEPVWTHSDESSLGSSPAVSGDTVFVTGTGGLHALDRESGDLRWSVEAVTDTYLKHILDRYPVVVDDTVYLNSNNGMYAIRADGEMAWQRVDGESPGWTPHSVVADGTVYTANEFVPGPVTALDAGTGEVRWRTDEDYPAGASVTTHDGVVYVSANRYDDGTDGVYALDADTGKRRWSRTGRDRWGFVPTVVATPDGHSADSRVLRGVQGHHHALARRVTGRGSGGPTTRPSRTPTETAPGTAPENAARVDSEPPDLRDLGLVGGFGLAVLYALSRGRGEDGE